jgi:hypothetical protein
MNTSGWNPRRWILTLALAAACACLSGGAGAAVPAGDPVFEEPLTITNLYFPVTPGAVKVFGGKDDGKRITLVENHLTETRDFEWNGQTVSCRIIETLKFESGQLIEKERGFFAQDVNGTVWNFGETEEDEEEDDEEEEEEEDEPDGWVVGQVSASDPEGVVSVERPTIMMVAVPERGDLWTVEDVPEYWFVTFLVRDANSRVRVPAGRFRGCAKIREDNVHDGDLETAWFAPGVGLVRASAKDEKIRLRATSFRAK